MITIALLKAKEFDITPLTGLQEGFWMSFSTNIKHLKVQQLGIIIEPKTIFSMKPTYCAYVVKTSKSFSC
jgi:hypothetical protein